MNDLRSTIEALGLENIERHIFLCADQTEPKCCAKQAGLESWEFLKRRLKELGLSGGKHSNMTDGKSFDHTPSVGFVARATG